MDGATSILLVSAKAAAFGNCRSAAWPWDPAGACRGSIGFRGHCLRQFILPKSDQNGWSYIHISVFRKSGRIWKLQVRSMAVGPRGCPTARGIIVTNNPRHILTNHCNSPRHISIPSRGIYQPTTRGIFLFMTRGISTNTPRHNIDKQPVAYIDKKPAA